MQPSHYTSSDIAWSPSCFTGRFEKPEQCIPAHCDLLTEARRQQSNLQRSVFFYDVVNNQHPLQQQGEAHDDQPNTGGRRKIIYLRRPANNVNTPPDVTVEQPAAAEQHSSSAGPHPHPHRRPQPQPVAASVAGQVAHPSQYELFIYIHGGYWQAMSPEHYESLAAAFVTDSSHLAVVGYDLCPQTTVMQQVHQISCALRYCLRHLTSLVDETYSHGSGCCRSHNHNRCNDKGSTLAQVSSRCRGVTVIGHSAGAHLALMGLWGLRKHVASQFDCKCDDDDDFGSASSEYVADSADSGNCDSSTLDCFSSKLDQGLNQSSVSAALAKDAGTSAAIASEASEVLELQLLERLILVSGIYDLRPLCSTYINAPLGLTEQSAWHVSPLRRTRALAAICCALRLQIAFVVAERDPPVFHDQARAMAAVLQQLVDPGHEEHDEHDARLAAVQAPLAPDADAPHSAEHHASRMPQMSQMPRLPRLPRVHFAMLPKLDHFDIIESLVLLTHNSPLMQFLSTFTCD